MAEQLRTKGKVERGRVGVSIQPVTENMAKPRPGGSDWAGPVRQRRKPVCKPEMSSPKSMVQSLSPSKISRAISARVKPGTRLQLEVWREGRSQMQELTVGQ